MSFRNAVFSLMALVALLAVPATSRAQEPLEPLVLLEGMRYGEPPSHFASDEDQMPLVMHSVEDANGKFSEASMAILNDQVDWDEQYVLVFSWTGSMEDSLSAAVSEGTPPHVTFTITQDLIHDETGCYNYVYVVRNDVEWDCVSNLSRLLNPPAMQGN